MMLKTTYRMLPDNMIEDLIKEIAGEEAVPLVNLIRKKNNVSEFKLAEKLHISVNQVRNILYKLSSYNLVSFTRKKDKKKGWYIYYWAFNQENAGGLIVDLKKKKLHELKDKLGYEINQSFFLCPDKHVRIKFDNALETEFKCPECGQVLNEHDNKDYIEDLKKQISQLESDLVVEQQLIKERMESAKAKEKLKGVKKKTAKKKIEKKSIQRFKKKKSKKIKQRIKKKISKYKKKKSKKRR